MISEEYLRNKKLQELEKIANVSEEELSKMNYKEKQQVYRAKSKLCKVFYRGGTYVKNETTKAS